MFTFQLCIPLCHGWIVIHLWCFFYAASVTYILLIQDRCSSQQSGELGSSTEAVDGIIGFGQANSSIISQLASAGKVKKIFSHCLDGINGGGIFAIGQVVQPKLKTTPLVPNEYVYVASFIFVVVWICYVCWLSSSGVEACWFC